MQAEKLLLLYEPGEHCLHPVAADKSEYNPAPQVRQADDDEALLYIPGVQDTQELAELALLMYPVGQAMHGVVDELVNEPAGQTVQAVALAALNEPLAHGVHALA